MTKAPQYPPTPLRFFKRVSPSANPDTNTQLRLKKSHFHYIHITSVFNLFAEAETKAVAFSLISRVCDTRRAIQGQGSQSLVRISGMTTNEGAQQSQCSPI